jgi:hypothetical protein
MKGLPARAGERRAALRRLAGEVAVRIGFLILELDRYHLAAAAGDADGKR